MPNWCNNALTVTGPRRVVRALLAQVDDRDSDLPTAFSLDRVLPLPAELLTAAEADGRPPRPPLPATPALPGDTWYRWQLRHWGTKWDVGAVVDLTDGPGPGELTAEFIFDSSGTPPIPVIDTLSAQYPACRLVLDYAGDGGRGVLRWAGGAAAA